MTEARREETGRSREMTITTNLSLEMDGFPRDLLRGFVSVSADRISGNETFRGDVCADGDGDDDDEIELNLGLSLGGRFGVDKTPGKLKRSSSIVGTMPICREQEEPELAAAAQPSNSTYMAGLTRTTSLPAEMEEEWRKRKGIQTLRRMEAKRRRCGKQKSCRISSSGNSDNHTASFGLESWVTAAARRGGFSQRHPASSRQGSVDSDSGGCGGFGRGGGSSSSLSELDSKNQHGSSNSFGEESIPGFITRCSSQERSNLETEKPGVSVTKPNETKRPARRHNSIDRTGNETAAMLDMPCVFTQGEGPNGRRIEGILYKYGKGEEVRIMCVCHGSFLSPAEFVRHAGGGDVDHPLRHIVVSTSSSASSSGL